MLTLHLRREDNLSPAEGQAQGDQLLRLAKSQRTLLPDGKSIRLEVTLTQSDFAALIGATRERVSRALSAFRTSGAIDWDKEEGRWIIRNPAALLKRVDM